MKHQNMKHVAGSENPCPPKHIRKGIGKVSHHPGCSWMEATVLSMFGGIGDSCIGAVSYTHLTLPTKA